jgi:surface antigen
MRKVLNQGTAVAAAILFLCVLVHGCAGGGGKARQGALLGGLGGAAVGGQLGPKEDRGKSAIIGAGIGAVLGYIIGNEWDKYDEERLTHTLETVPSGRTTEWVNPDTGNRYIATPEPAYRQDDRIYRDIEIDGYVDGKRETVHAKAYRNPDGSWQLVQ